MYKYTKWRSLYLDSLPRSFWYSLTFAGTFLGIYAVLVLSKYASMDNPVPMDVAMTLAALTSFVIAWIGVKRSHEQRNVAPELRSLQRRLCFWVPLAFSIALLFQGLGNGLLGYYDVLTIEGPPIWGMIAILGMYPALLAGIFLLPRGALSGKVPLRFVMDSLMLIAAMVTFSWYFLLGPILIQGQKSSTPLGLFSIGYATFDLLVISCLILLSRSLADRGLRNAMRSLSLALVIFVFTDSILVILSSQGPPNTAWLALGWIGGNFAIGLSLQAIRWLSTRATDTSGATLQAASLVATPIWRSLLPYALVPVVIWLVLSVWGTNKSGPLAIGTYVCSLLLLILIFAKQLLAIQEIHGLNRGFQRLQRVVDEKNTALGEANTRLETLATTDPLTELPNHRALVAALDQELARSQQYQRSCSLLFFDLDHFKALNDGYGHAGGDTALREFGSLLRATLPLIHTVGRWGGEEFIAVLPEETATEAATIAEGLRSTVANHSFSIGGGMQLTCSIGVASYPTHALQQQELLQAADSAMYGAKKLGRNQVRLIDDPAVIALLATNSSVEGRDEVALIGTVHALALLVEKRDVETGEHSQRVGELLLSLAQSLQLSEPEAQLLSLAGQLHDIGKIVIADSILQKQDPLTEQELASVHQHPQVGAEVVSAIPSLRVLAPIIHAHHEWWNGMGYPDQLAGEAIPFGARLLAVVDAYVAMTTGRPQQEAHEPAWALAELQQAAGTQFDPTIVKQFLLLQATSQTSREEVGIA